MIDIDLAAEVIARMRSTEEVDLFVSDARLLTSVMGTTWGRLDTEAIAERLRVSSSP